MRELNMQEVEEVSGGFDVSLFVAGLGAIGLGVAILGTAGLATVPISILGAATVGEMMIAGTSLALGAAGGFAMGASGSSGKDEDS